VSKPRKIRRAFVEYQPNLNNPVAPVRLGILAEETTGGEHTFVIVGREPKDDFPGLDELWGPFRTIVTEWVGVMGKSLREHVEEISNDSFALDELAKHWNSNVYIVTPELKEVRTAISLMTYATRWWEQSSAGPTRTRRGTGTKADRKPHGSKYWRARTNSVVESRV
jgi:hypothetical protein